MTPPPSLQELIDTVRQDSGTDDPIGQLSVASATAADLEQTTDALLGHFVNRCRQAGRSWSEISTALGVTKQAVHKRFAGPLAERLAEMTGRPTFERFTIRARSVLVAASAAAEASGHPAIGTEHVLLGLYAEPDGVAAKVLLAMQVSRDQVAAALRTEWARPAEAPAGPATPAGGGPDTSHGQPGKPAAPPPDPGDQATGHLPWTPRARAALVNAVAIALEFGHNYIGTEHLLLGLYRDQDCLAARVLADLGPEPAEAQARVAELLRGYSKS
jgi:ATP-dependent Clp protease ATP-binding subunit ClpA